MKTVRLFGLGATIAMSWAAAVQAEFPNGVASGDVTHDSAVLWTRSDAVGTVKLEYSTDPGFAAVLGSEHLDVTDPLLPVKSTITGLEPGTRYYYRAVNGDRVAAGQFSTPGESGVESGLRIALLTDWQQAPPFPAVSNVPSRNPDLVLKLGDTIYADLETPGLPGVSQARTLEQFRIKHEEVLSARPAGTAGDFRNFMRDVYASAPVLSTIDDHEIVDNFAGGAAPGESPDAPEIGSSDQRLFTDGVGSAIGDPVPADARFVNETTVYRNALQAYQEYHPLDPQVWTGTSDARLEGKPKLYRHVQYGGDASVTMLDSRSFRDAQLAPPSNPFDAARVADFFTASLDPNRTLLGRAQVDRLKADLLDAQRSGTTWKFVTIPEPIQEFGIVNAEDRLEGYAAERSEILGFIDQNDIENVVFVAGDFHGNIVNDLSYSVPTAGGLQSIDTNAFEIVTGPVAFFDGRFGPNVASIGFAAGLLNEQELAFYESLPIAADVGVAINDRDDVIENLVNQQIALTSLGGENAVGLSDSELIDAVLREGDYLASHRFQWTELDIDERTQVLTVTTWGIDPYSEQDVLDAIADGDLAAIEGLTPQVVSRFEVTPIPEPTSLAVLALGGVALMGLRHRRRTR